MPNVESFLRGELRAYVSATQSVPFDMAVSKVPNLDNQYLTVEPDTDNEEIFYFTTRSGTAGSPGTVHVTARGYNTYDSSTSSANQKGHAVNSEFRGSINHIMLNQKAGKDEENAFTELIVPPTFANTTAADSSWTGGSAPNGAMFYSTADGCVMEKNSGVWQKSVGAADYAQTRSVATGSASSGELYRNSGDSNNLHYKNNTGSDATVIVDSTSKLASGVYDFATLSDAQTGTDVAKPMNAARVKDAITQFAPQLASDAEAQAGTVTTKAITPAQLAANAAAFVRSAWSTDFSTAARYTASVNGLGTNTFDASGVTMNGGGTNGNWAKIIYNPGKPFSVGDRVSFTVANSSSGTNYELYFGVGTVAISGSNHTFTNSHIGFKILNPVGVFNFSATVANGTTETATTLTTTSFTMAALEASIFYRSASAIEFTYRTNGGSWSSPVTITTNIPSTQTTVQLDALTGSGGGGALVAYGMGGRS